MTLPSLLRFFLEKNFPSFHHLQLFSIFLKYSLSNLLSSHPYSILAVNLPSNLLLLYVLSSSFLILFAVSSLLKY